MNALTTELYLAPKSRIKLSDRTFTPGVVDRQIEPVLVDLLNYFPIQPVLHSLCINKGCGMYFSVCGMVYVKEPLLLTGKIIHEMVTSGWLSCD